MPVLRHIFIALIVPVVCFCALRSHACVFDPIGPSTSVESDHAVVRAPNLEFAREINRLFPDAPLDWYLRAVPGEDPAKQSRDVDVDELDDAIPLLRRAAGLFAPDEEWASDAPTGICMRGVKNAPWDTSLAPRREVIGELAAAFIAKRQCLEALRLQLAAEIRDDAAYVMECILTVDELRRFIDTDYPIASPPKSVDDNADAGDDHSEFVPEFVRHTYGGRLARLGRIDEARPWLDPELGPFATRYLDAMKRSRDTHISSADRAAALWGAAQALAGSTLTELRHDGGYYALFDRDDTLLQVRRDSPGLNVLPPSADERARLGRLPDQYDRVRLRLYLATDLAWEAAELSPDESDQTAEMLSSAGRWLPNCKNQSADRFFKALVRRCSTTRLGAETTAIHWFPPEGTTGAAHPGFRAADRYARMLQRVIAAARANTTCLSAGRRRAVARRFRHPPSARSYGTLRVASASQGSEEPRITPGGTWMSLRLSAQSWSVAAAVRESGTVRERPPPWLASP
jgi:hypothetical protein